MRGCGPVTLDGFLLRRGDRGLVASLLSPLLSVRGEVGSGRRRIFGDLDTTCTSGSGDLIPRRPGRGEAPSLRSDVDSWFRCLVGRGARGDVSVESEASYESEERRSSPVDGLSICVGA